SGSGARLVEAGMEAAAAGAYQLRKGVDVGAFEFRELAVLEHLPNDLVLGRELFEDIGGGRDRFPLPVTDGSGELQVLEQNLAELLGRADIERLAGDRVDLLGEPPDRGIHDDRESSQLDRIDANAVRLHPGEHAGE